MYRCPEADRRLSTQTGRSDVPAKATGAGQKLPVCFRLHDASNRTSQNPRPRVGEIVMATFE